NEHSPPRATTRGDLEITLVCGMGKPNTAEVTTNCLMSPPNIKHAVVVVICSAVPFDPDGANIVLGDVIIRDGVVKYDLGCRSPENLSHRDTLLDCLGRPSREIRTLLAKLKAPRGRKELAAKTAPYLEVLQAHPDLVSNYP